MFDDKTWRGGSLLTDCATSTTRFDTLVGLALEPMARSGGGRFHFIPDASSITDVVAGELGELRSLYARRSVVDVSLPPGVALRRGLNKYEVDQGASGLRVYIGDLLSGDLKRVVLEVSTPPGSIGESLYVTSLVTYMDVETNRHREQGFPPVELRYAPVHAVRSQPVNREVDREVSLLHSAHARDEASPLSCQGRHDEALRILRETAGKLNRSPYSSEPAFAAEAAAVGQRWFGVGGRSSGTEHRQVLDLPITPTQHNAILSGARE